MVEGFAQEGPKILRHGGCYHMVPADGWFRVPGADPAKPIAMPGGQAVPHAFPLSGDFSTNRMGIQWRFYQGTDVGRTLHVRIRNDRHIVTMQCNADGRVWERFDRGMEPSGYHHNVAYEFRSLRPALHAAGTGEVRFRSLRHRALD